jgi:hypothetical protein
MNITELGTRYVIQSLTLFESVQISLATRIYNRLGADFSGLDCIYISSLLLVPSTIPSVRSDPGHTQIFK